jgi:hypothetical protein
MPAWRACAGRPRRPIRESPGPHRSDPGAPGLTAARATQARRLQLPALHGGAEPDLLDEVAWWQTDDFWQYGLFAAVGYIRAAASRAGVPVRQACQDLAGHPGQAAQ